MPYLTMTDKTELYVKDWGSGRPAGRSRPTAGTIRRW